MRKIFSESAISWQVKGKKLAESCEALCRELDVENEKHEFLSNYEKNSME